MPVTFGLRVAFVPFIAVVLCGFALQPNSPRAEMPHFVEGCIANLIIAITV
jgi:hypothetical protein